MIDIAAKTIRRYPDIDFELLRRKWIRHARAWYLAKALADPSGCGLVPFDDAVDLISAVTPPKAKQWRDALLAASDLHCKGDKGASRGFLELVHCRQVDCLRILNPAAVCMLLGIAWCRHAPIDLPLRALCGTIADAKRSLYESAVRSQFSDALIARKNRAADLGISKSTTHRYDLSLDLEICNNWAPVLDAEGMLYTSGDSNTLHLQAREMNRSEEKYGLYRVISIANLPVQMLRHIANGQSLGNYLIIRQLPGTYEHIEGSTRARESINRRLHTFTEKATVSSTTGCNRGRSWAGGTRLYRVAEETHPRDKTLWVPRKHVRQKLTPADMRPSREARSTAERGIAGTHNIGQECNNG